MTSLKRPNHVSERGWQLQLSMLLVNTAAAFNFIIIYHHLQTLNFKTIQDINYVEWQQILISQHTWEDNLHQNIGESDIFKL